MKMQKYILLVLSLVLGPSVFAYSKALTPAFVDTVVEPYLQIQKGLADDDLDAAKSAATDYVKAFEVADPGPSLEEAALLDPAKSIAAASDLKAARKELPVLSSEVQSLVEHVGTTGNTPLYRAYCPMASDGKGGYANWLQSDKTIRNPYYGAQMLHCGVIDKQVSKH